MNFRLKNTYGDIRFNEAAVTEREEFLKSLEGKPLVRLVTDYYWARLPDLMDACISNNILKVISVHTVDSARNPIRSVKFDVLKSFVVSTSQYSITHRKGEVIEFDGTEDSFGAAQKQIHDYIFRDYEAKTY